MRPKLSAFPKCYLDRIAGDHTMTVFEWIEMARPLDADGLEMYEGFFTSLDDAYLDEVGEAIHRAVEREATMIRVCRRLGGPHTVCRVLSGQRYPGVSRAEGIQWVAECILNLVPVAREHGVVM